MEDRFNTVAGWTLFAGIVALGLTSVSSKIFHADKPERPEKMGYAIAGVVQEGGTAAAAVPIETLLAAADPAKGEASYKKCLSCHTINPGGASGIGPNLHGIVGKGVGAGGFAYSDGLKALGGKWDFATLNKWLTNPKALVSGTKMTYAGMDSAEERAGLIVYLNSQGSNLPLPAAPAAAEPAAEGAAVAPPAGEAAAPAAK